MTKQNNVKKMFKLAYFIFLATIRNPSAIFFGFLFPFIFIAVFGLIGGSGSSFDVGVLSSSSKSGIVYESLTKIDALNLITEKTDEELAEDLKKGQISAIIEINETDELVPGLKKTEINLQTTSADPNGGAAIASIVNSVSTQYNNEVATNVLGEKVIQSSEVKIQNIEGRKYTQIDFILPGQLSFALLSTGVFTIAFSIITLRKTLVLKRMFATPTPKWVIMGAKVISSLVMGILQSAVIIGVGHFAFSFTLINGISTFISMIIVALIGLIVFLGLGLFVASLGNDEDSVSPIANIITMPQFLLSGAFFSTELFPEVLKFLSKLMPMTYLNEAMRAIAFDGASFETILPKLATLVLIGGIIYIVTLRIFKWE